MASIHQLIAPQCATCRKLLVPGQPSALGAVTLSSERGWHLCGECVGRGRAVLGGAMALAGAVARERAPVAYKLAEQFYIGMRGAQPLPKR